MVVWVRRIPTDLLENFPDLISEVEDNLEDEDLHAEGSQKVREVA